MGRSTWETFDRPAPASSTLPGRLRGGCHGQTLAGSDSTGDEEVGSATSRTLIEAEAEAEAVAARARAVLVTEGAAPPGGALNVARREMALYTVRATGVAAHSGSAPHLGRNTTMALAAVVGRLQAWRTSRRHLRRQLHGCAGCSDP